MRNRKQVDEPHNDRNGLALLAFALLLGGIAVVADVAWMAPHASSATMTTQGAAAQDEARQQAPTTEQQPTAQSETTSTASYYFPSQFTVDAKDTDEPPAPTF